MNQPSTLLLLTAAILLSASISAAQDDNNVTESEPSVNELIAQLSADKSVDRQEALRKLIEIGYDAVDPIALSIEDGPTDKRMRSMAVLQKMASSEDAELAAHASTAIQKLSYSDDRMISIFARQAASRVNQSVKENAIQKLLDAGAEFLNAEVKENIQYLAKYQIRIGEKWKGDLSDLDSLLWLQETTEVVLMGEHIDNSVVDVITKLPKLSWLRIRDAKINCETFELLEKVETLQDLEIRYCDIGDDCVAAISLLKIGSLQVCGTNLTKQGILAISQKSTMRIDHRLGGFLGINYSPGGNELLITHVGQGTPADRHGLIAGDIITKYDNKVIRGPIDFAGTVSNNRAGDRVTLEVLRNSKKMNIEVVLGKFIEP